MSIRQIGEQDIADCVEVIRVSFMTIAKQFNITPENAPAFTAFATDEKKILHWMNEQHRPMYGYYDGDKLAGYYNLLVNGNDSELGSLCVLPDYRLKGIGEALLKDSVKRAKDLGCKTMKLSIVEENTILRQWYESFGFKHTGTVKYEFFPFTCGYLEMPL